MQRVGSMLMMIPLMMQVLSLPGAIASIKASLLKSLFIGKLALIIMIYNLIISFRPKSEVVVVNHQPKMPEHYDHYYSPYDDDDSGWFG
ncbi:GSCOCG00004779001-RA-CDS [Cotesia congregata]|nr:GSCOCG00004779001-RA-CDS [Cotesia congregata]